MMGAACLECVKMDHHGLIYAFDWKWRSFGGLPTLFPTCNLTTVAHILVNNRTLELVQPSKYLTNVSLTGATCLGLVKFDHYDLIYAFDWKWRSFGGLPTSFPTCNLTTISHILVNNGTPEPVQPSKYLAKVSVTGAACLEWVKLDLYHLMYAFGWKRRSFGSLHTLFLACNLTMIAHILDNNGTPEPVQPSKYLAKVFLMTATCLEWIKSDLYGLIYTFDWKWRFFGDLGFFRVNKGIMRRLGIHCDVPCHMV